MILLGLGIFLTTIGVFVGADEWRRAGTQQARINESGLRVEMAGASAVLLGIGIAIAYAGVSA